MTQTKQHVRVEYRLRPEVDLEQQKRDVAAFVAAIHAHRATSRYTSFQDLEDPRHFVHVGEFDADAVPSLTKQEFFLAFTQLLRERTVAPPEATRLAMVATTVS